MLQEMGELSVIGVCISISKGGLRLERVELQNQSFLMKVGFNLVQKKGQIWAQALGSIKVQVGRTSPYYSSKLKLLSTLERSWSSVV